MRLIGWAIMIVGAICAVALFLTQDTWYLGSLGFLLIVAGWIVLDKARERERHPAA